ncbi:hypothetical protein MHBO_000990, partial [Bonamia ostreae]
CLRVPAPDGNAIKRVLKDICTKEEISVPESFGSKRQVKLEKVVAESEGNVRRAILALELSMANGSDEIAKLAWKKFIGEVALLICEEQSSKRLLVVRSKLYELLNRLIPPGVILKELVLELMEKCDFELQREVVRFAAFHELRMAKGSKPIYHLEAFVAKFMSLYQKWSQDYFEDH